MFPKFHDLKLFRLPIFHTTLINGKRFKKSGCRRAIVEIPPDPPDEICRKACRETKKPLGILHKIKLKIIEGGTNFGAPFARLRCKGKEIAGDVCEKKKLKALPPPLKKEKVPAPVPLNVNGVQVAILGADTAIGQYVALLLKQCSCIKRLRLFESAEPRTCCVRKLCQVVEDLKHIDTNCNIQAYYHTGTELERCLQSADIVLMLDSPYVTSDMSCEQRFCLQAPLVKYYVDCISNECPKAFIIVCTTPIDCMVPLVGMTLQETGWYNQKKVLGSMAVPEMRASTLAARALGLEPWYTRVPCVGGTEGTSLVPLFSRAVEQFDFALNNAMMMTQVIRNAPQCMAGVDYRCCTRAADLSEAHAISGLVTKVAHALLCNDVPTVSGFVEIDQKQVVSPASKYMGRDVILSGTGIIKYRDLPPGLNDFELEQIGHAIVELDRQASQAEGWHCTLMEDEKLKRSRFMTRNFVQPRHFKRIEECIDKHFS